MTETERLAATEEALMRLQLEHEQLDRVVQAQARTLHELEQRVEGLEQRLDRARSGDE